jgi:hypothetical protein
MKQESRIIHNAAADDDDGGKGIWLVRVGTHPRGCGLHHNGRFRCQLSICLHIMLNGKVVPAVLYIHNERSGSSYALAAAPYGHRHIYLIWHHT